MKRLLILLCLFASACGGSSSSSPTSAAPVTPQYGAIWSGTYVVNACTQSGLVAIVNVCGGNLAVGSVLPFTMTLAQVSSTITQGVFQLGTIGFVVQPATITANSALTLTGSNTNSGVTIAVTWNFTSPLVGGHTQVWSATALTGVATVNSTIATAVKTGTADRMPLLPPLPTSLEEALRSLRQ